MANLSIKSNYSWFGPFTLNKKDIKDYLNIPKTVTRNGQVVSIKEWNKQAKINHIKSKGRK